MVTPNAPTSYGSHSTKPQASSEFDAREVHQTL